MARCDRAVGVVLLLALAGGCDDDYAMTDGGAGDGSSGDGGVIVKLPATGDDGADQLGAKLSAGQVRAGKVTRRSQLLSGIKVEGKVGDFKLYNNKVAFIIAAERYTDGYAPYGGELLDAMRLGQPSTEGHSLLGETIMAIGTKIVKPTSVGVVNDGADGKAAVVRVIGELAPVPIFEGMLPGVGGTAPVAVVIEYALEPNSEKLSITWRVFNRKDHVTEIPLTLMGLVAGDGLDFFDKEIGFNVDSYAPSNDYVAMIGDSIGYVLYSSDVTLKPLVVYTGLWAVSSGAMKVPAAGELRRKFVFAVTKGEPYAAQVVVHDLRGDSGLMAVSGTVSDSAGPVKGARLHVTSSDDKRYVTMVRTTDKGHYQLRLPRGSYALRAVADGREPAKKQLVTVGAKEVHRDLKLGGVGTVSFSVSDGAGDLPAKVVFKRAKPLASLPASFGEQTFPGGAANITFYIGGTKKVRLPPGDYAVTVSRGFEYELGRHELSLSDGDDKTLSFKLRRSVDTKGWLCGDFHMHAMWSPDSSDLYEFKMAAAAAEGLELPVATDHEYIADYNPTIAKLGLQKWMRGIVGEEVTTFVYGHFNPLPISATKKDPNRGAVVWFEKAPAQLFSSIHKRWPNAVLQVNHPRSPAIAGYFNYVGFDPVAGTFTEKSKWSTDFEMVEVFNGKRGWTESSKTIKDWFSLLERGKIVTATGNSDSHHALSSEVGFPRNYVKLSTETPANVSLSEFTKALRDHRVVVSGGAFVTASAQGKGVGSLVAAKNGKIQLSVKVQAATWVDVDNLDVYMRGSLVKRVKLDASKADKTNPVVRYDDTMTLDVRGGDSWVVVVATGSETLDPVVRGETAFAATNAILIDGDGNGKYDAPAKF